MHIILLPLHTETYRNKYIIICVILIKTMYFICKYWKILIINFSVHYVDYNDVNSVIGHNLPALRIFNMVYSILSFLFLSISLSIYA